MTGENPKGGYAPKAARSRERDESAFHNLLEAAPDGSLFVDSSGIVRLANAPCTQLFGFEPGDLIGTAVEMLVPLPLQAKPVGLPAAYFKDHPPADAVRSKTNKSKR